MERVVKYFLFLTIVAAFPEMDLPLQEWKKLVQPYTPECIDQSTQQLLDNFWNHGEVSDNAGFKCALKCIATKLDILSSEGNINISNVQKFHGVTEEVARLCAQTTEVDPCQIIYNLIGCCCRMMTEE
ncbi:hypothetical protein ILUMI_13479 [Ignelater luminosus]|uniref:Uncharacterized protein n=1 Tax=Ignelater luminosus TaxID=2038154 RepID=A0A8K0GBE7_IGNLU|nr:hypothetical protein ILUMI_13479 [Ignelater luminosus]